MVETVEIAGRTAIVTGGGTGIGRATALALAGLGANVMICGRRLEPLQEVIAAADGAPGVCRAQPADMANAGDIESLVAATTTAFGPVDILVNNAGIGGGGFIHNHEVSAWDRIMAVNLRAPFLMSRAVLPEMRRRGSGHIINISSESGLEHYPGNGAYGVSKHALNALGEFIQGENQEFGIRVDTVCPGMVVTEMSRDMPGLNEAKALQPEEIADLIVWLLTRQANVKIGRPVLIQTMANPWQAG